MKQQRELAILAVLLVIAASVWYFFYFRKEGVAAGTASMAAIRKPGELLAIDNPSLHWPELLRAQKTEYKCDPTCRNPFSKEAPAPPAPLQPAALVRQPVGPQQAPPIPPPTLPGNLKFFGYGTVPNGTARRAFFSDGDDVIIVSEGETLLGRYRILKVNNTNLEFEEMATGRRNTAPLVEEQPSQPST
jgi:hypothetical protein